MRTGLPVPVVITLVVAGISAAATTYGVAVGMAPFDGWTVYAYLFPALALLLLSRSRVVYWLLLVSIGLPIVGGISFFLILLFNEPHTLVLLLVGVAVLVYLALFVSLRRKGVRHWLTDTQPKREEPAISASRERVNGAGNK